MTIPTRSDNESRRARLINRLAPAVISVDRADIRRAPYAITAEVPEAQEQALIDHAIELGGPPGTVIGREVTDADGRHVEILLGWERVEAYLHRDAFAHASSIPVGLMDINNAEAAFYGIEYAAQNQKASGLVTSPLLYAAAAKAALETFSRPDTPWAIQTLANALCIARPTLSNRLRLLKRLSAAAQRQLQAGLIKPEFAKILMGERDPARQAHFATLASRGLMSTRSLYKLVYPDYEPPQTVASPRNRQRQSTVNLSAAERALSERYGTTATIALGNKQRQGSVELAFHSLSELQGLLKRLENTVHTDPLVHGALTLTADNAQAVNDLLLELGANTDPALD